MEGTVKKKVARNPKDLDILVKMISRSGGMGCSNSTGPQSGLTESQKTVIKKSWDSFKRKGTIEEIGMPMFIKLFEEAPEVKPFFKFMDGNNTEKDIKLENHVKGVFDVVGTAVEMIDNLNQLSPVVVDLGTRHFHYGSRKEHLPVVGKCLIHAIASALGEEFTDETKDAWLSFYNWLGGCFAKGVSTESRK